MEAKLLVFTRDRARRDDRAVSNEFRLLSINGGNAMWRDDIWLAKIRIKVKENLMQWGGLLRWCSSGLHVIMRTATYFLPITNWNARYAFKIFKYAISVKVTEILIGGYYVWIFLYNYCFNCSSHWQWMSVDEVKNCLSYFNELLLDFTLSESAKFGVNLGNLEERQSTFDYWLLKKPCLWINDTLGISWHFFV